VQQFNGLGVREVDEYTTYPASLSGAASRATLVSITAGSFEVQGKNGTSLFKGTLTKLFRTDPYSSTYTSKTFSNFG
jgi:hypothetical protein